MNFIAGASVGSKFTNAGINLSLTPSTDSRAADGHTMHGIYIGFTAGSVNNSTINAINIPTIAAASGTGVQYALNVGQNWTYGLNTLSPVLISSTRTGTGAGLTITEGSLTTADALDITGGPNMTTGSLISATSGSYNHGAAETGNLVNLAFTDATNLNSNTATTTNGINIASTINVTGGASSNGAKTIN